MSIVKILTILLILYLIAIPVTLVWNHHYCADPVSRLELHRCDDVMMTMGFPSNYLVYFLLGLLMFTMIVVGINPIFSSTAALLIPSAMILWAVSVALNVVLVLLTIRALRRR